MMRCAKSNQLHNLKIHDHRHKHNCINSVLKHFALRAGCLSLLLQLITPLHIYAPHVKRPNSINSNNQTFLCFFISGWNLNNLGHLAPYSQIQAVGHANQMQMPQKSENQLWARVINTEFSLLAFQKQPVGVHMQMICKQPRRRELLFF